MKRDNQGRFVVNQAGKAIQGACNVLQALLALHKAGDSQGALKLLNSASLRPIVIVEVVQGRPLTADESRQYTSYPCVDPDLKTAMKSGKKFEELKRASRVELHSGEFNSRFAEFVRTLETGYTPVY